MSSMNQEQSEPSGDEALLLAEVPKDGKVIGNKSLRDKLKWQPNRYFTVRNSLVERNILALGKGKGGSVYRVGDDVVAVETVAKQIAEEVQREQDLYQPLSVGLKTWLSSERQFENVIVEVTAGQGARNTGGKWTRPDLTAVAVEWYELLPGKHLNTITFEVKASDGWDITAVFEAAAHSRFATESFLAIHTPNGDPQGQEWTRVQNECTRFRIGLLTFDDPKNSETFAVIIDAVKQVPDPKDMDSFLARQLSEVSKKTIVKWIK